MKTDLRLFTEVAVKAYMDVVLRVASAEIVHDLLA